MKTTMTASMSTCPNRLRPLQNPFLHKRRRWDGMSDSFKRAKPYVDCSYALNASRAFVQSKSRSMAWDLKTVLMLQDIH